MAEGDGRSEVGRVVDAFNRYAARPPSRVKQVLGVVLVVGATAAFWERRGVIVGLVAFAAYGIGFTVVSFKHAETMRWSRAHPAMDSLGVVPLAFLAAAYVSSWRLVVCVGVALAAGLVMTRWSSSVTGVAPSSRDLHPDRAHWSRIATHPR